MNILQALLGLGVFFSIAYYLSSDKENISKRAVIQGCFTLFAFGLIVFKVPYVQSFLLALNHVVEVLEQATSEGTYFVFGYLNGEAAPFVEQEHGNTFILIFQALPLVIVISALSSLLFYWGVLPYLIGLLSYMFNKLLGLRSAVGLGSAANIFLGMDSAPLLIRPHLKYLTKSELFIFMTVGMATVSSTVVILYASILRSVVDHGVGHIFAASFLNVAAAILIARIMIPETEDQISGNYIDEYTKPQNSMDALAEGVSAGIKILLNIAGMLVALVALVALFNIFLNAIPFFAERNITIQVIFGYFLAPVAWLMGIPYEDIYVSGTLLATKIVLNELLAYIELAKLSPAILDMRSKIIMVYSLCGFANFASIGILIGALTALIPTRRAEIANMGFKAMIAGTLANLVTGTVVGIFV